MSFLKFIGSLLMGLLRVLLCCVLAGALLGVAVGIFTEDNSYGFSAAFVGGGLLFVVAGLIYTIRRLIGLARHEPLPEDGDDPAFFAMIFRALLEVLPFLLDMSGGSDDHEPHHASHTSHDSGFGGGSSRGGGAGRKF